MGFFDKFGEWWNRKKEDKGVTLRTVAPVPTEKITREEWDFIVAESIPVAKSQCKAFKRIGHKFGGQDAKRHWVKTRAGEIATLAMDDPSERQRVRHAVNEIVRKKKERSDKRMRALEAVNAAAAEREKAKQEQAGVAA